MNSEIAGLVLVSHGNFAMEALKSAEMIMGPIKNVNVLSVVPGMDLKETARKLEEAVNEVKGNAGVIIMTDIIGGTPSNAAGILSLSMDNILALSGFNMPMLLEVLISRNLCLNEIAEKICNAGRDSIVNITENVKKSLK